MKHNSHKNTRLAINRNRSHVEIAIASM